ncbi:MAG: nuclear transport factor 2 family protein [Pseudomonadota bacterium]
MIDTLVSSAIKSGFPANLDHPIVARRAAFNDAIREKKTGPIKRLLSSDVVLVTGSDSGAIVGRDAQLAIWRDGFQSAERLVFSRTPHCVLPSPVEPLATELGTWIGKPERADGSDVRGDYTAKWRQEGGGWLLEAEIFTTTGCRPPLSLA